jgi:tRNA-dihydrouridine synthase
VKVGATRTFNDVKLAVHSGADVVVVDGMQGGTAATQTCFIEHVGIPTLAAVRQAVDALEDLNMKGKVQLIVSGGIRTGADVAKALAMGADAVAIGQGVLVALGCNGETYFQNGATTTPSPTTPRWAPRRASATTATPASARSASPRRTPSWNSACSRKSGRAPQELPEDAEHGAHHHRPRLRQAERASPGTGRSGRAHHGRSRRHGRRPAGRHQLDRCRPAAARPRRHPPTNTRPLLPSAKRSPFATR